MFGMNPVENQNIYNNAAASPYDPVRDSAPGFLDGSLTALPTGFEELGLEAAQYVDHDAEDQKKFQIALEGLKPNPQTTGLMANILQGVGSTLPPFAAGPVAGALIVGQLKGYAKMKELQGKGVDTGTAAEAGVIEGVTQGVGGLLPASLGGKVVARVGAGAGINLTTGMINRGATGEVLAANGYKDMAAQYHTLDGMQMLTDAVLGGAFGAIHSGERPEPKPSDIDLALAANNIHQLELDSAPGIPADLATRNAHVDAMTRATEQLLRDEPVNVSLKDANFLAHPVTRESIDFSDAIKGGLGDLETTAAKLFKQEPLTGSEHADLMAHIESPELFAELERSRGLQDNIATKLNDLTERAGQMTESDLAVSDRLDEIDSELKKTDDTRRIARLNRNRNELFEGIPNEKRQQIEMYHESKILDARIKEISPKVKELTKAAKERVQESQRAIALAAQTVKKEPTKIDVASKQPSKSKGDGRADDTNVVNKNESKPTEGADDIGAATKIAAEKPDMIIPDEAGEMTATEAMQKADDDIAQAQKDSTLFETAVNCLLRFST